VTERTEQVAAALRADPVGLEVSELVADYGGSQAVRGVSFAVEPSEFVTLLGPSGCGKTTTLRCVAGLHPVRAGTIAVGGEVLSSDRIHLRPERRRINMVFQSYAIWPHMTVFDNVAYGMKGRRGDRAGRDGRVRDLLDLVGLADFADRGASGLSGGQQQRVALARALATSPRVLLLDEPLSNLDAVLRGRMRSEIMRIQQETGTTTLYVTHDRREALSMSDRIVIMRDGVVEQSGTPEELYDRPVSRFVAEFLAFANVVRAKVTAAGRDGIRVRAHELDGEPELSIDRAGDEARPAPGEDVEVVIRPDSMRPATSESTNVITGRLLTREFLGNRSEVTIRSGAHLIKAESARLVSADGDGNLSLYAPPESLTWVPAGEGS
jgi:ABC-type Fe3+/spermidine/putrescine transport system ATPase subunit